jgi:NTE family protein
VRGLTHLGVLRACEHLEIHPEIVVGASTGALIGAAYGQGIPLDVLLEGYRLPWRRRHRGPRVSFSTFVGLPTFSQWTDPGHLLSGLFSIDKFERHLRQLLPINDFRKLSETVLVTAVDIDRGKRVVFGRGYEESVPISQAVAASCCLPGLLRPYRIGNSYYADGEVVRSLSTDLAVKAGADVIIACSAHGSAITDGGVESIARRGVHRVVRQALNIELSHRERMGLQLHSLSHPNTVVVDVSPDLGDFGYFDRFAARALVRRGYRTALLRLREAIAKGIFGAVGPRSERQPTSN